MVEAQTTIEYRIKSRDGALVAIHRHVWDAETGGKACYWRRPDGKSGLNGTRLEDLPLYGADELDEDAVLIVLVEGEKARDALAAALEGTGVCVIGTVTGACVTPSHEALEDLRGHEVVLWPDADAPGREHMRRVAERLYEVAAAVSIFDWPEAKEKGDDAADHPGSRAKMRRASTGS